jgi:hypothetical protein
MRRVERCDHLLSAFERLDRLAQQCGIASA